MLPRRLGSPSASRTTLIHEYTELYGLSTVCLGYFTVYGPRMRPNLAISNFVSRCPRERRERGLGSACASGV